MQYIWNTKWLIRPWILNNIAFTPNTASRINEFNAEVLVVSRRLGHRTLKHYVHLWSRNDEPLAEKMAANIKFNFSKENKLHQTQESYSEVQSSIKKDVTISGRGVMNSSFIAVFIITNPCMDAK